MTTLYRKVLNINHIDSKLLGIPGICDMIKQYALLGEFQTVQSHLFRDRFENVNKLIQTAVSRNNASRFFSETSEVWAFGFIGAPGTEGENLQLQGMYCGTCGECKKPPTNASNVKRCVCQVILTPMDEGLFFDLSQPIAENMEWLTGPDEVDPVDFQLMHL